MSIAPVTLAGRSVVLTPWSDDALDEVARAALSSPEVWRYFPARVATSDDVAAFVAGFAHHLETSGTGLMFVTRERGQGRVIGGSSFLNADETNRKVEIGFTWLLPAWQRTAVNTEAKSLMLEHAFTVLGALRVEFKADARNERSRAALLRLGAREEGTLRSHMICWDGHRRDSVYFSVLDTEWPAVRERLASRLSRAAFGAP